MTNFYKRYESTNAPLTEGSVESAPQRVLGTSGRIPAHSCSAAGLVAEGSKLLEDVVLLEREGKSGARRREHRRVGTMEGAQHSGTVRGLGGIKGRKERGRRR